MEYRINKRTGDKISIIGMVGLMFSINPAYDYQKGDYANGNINERFELYKRCETEGVGISVMKAFSGGQLLDDKRSPFGKELTKIQCIQYDLDKPGVLTVLPGIRIKEDLEEILKYENSTEEEKDYSIISDLSILGDTLAKEHYRSLEKNAKDCISCGHCNSRCPFKVDQMNRMKIIAEYFEKE